MSFESRVNFTDLFFAWNSNANPQTVTKSVEVQVDMPEMTIPETEMFHVKRPRDESKEDYTERRRKQRQCQHVSGCERYAQGNTKLCISHGGGRRCEVPGCTKSVQGARSFRCIAHGGGRRCEVTECSRSARGSSNRCVHHGGGIRCAVVNCDKSAQRPSDYCINHGGGKRCTVLGCLNGSRPQHPHLCISHARESVAVFSNHGLPSALQNLI